MAHKCTGVHGKPKIRYAQKDVRSSSSPPDCPAMATVFDHNSIQAEVLIEYKRGTPRDDIWESLWNVLRAGHPQMLVEELDQWVNELTRPIY